MSVLYIETSALLVWLFGQPGSQEVRKQVDAASRVVTSALTIIEAERSFIRAERLKRLSLANIGKLRSLLYAAKSEWLVLNISDTVQRQAMQTFVVEPVRTLDAIHLASVIVLLAAYPDLKVLSFDDRIIGNAKALGLLATVQI